MTDNRATNTILGEEKKQEEKYNQDKNRVRKLK